MGELVVSEHLNLLDAKKHIVVSVDAGDHVQRYHARKADRDVEWVVFRFQKTKLAINWTVLGRPKDSDGPLARFSVADVIRITKADHGATSKDRAALLEIEDARAAHKIEQAKIELRNMANAKKKSKAPRAVVPRAPTPASSGVSPADMAFWRKTFEAEVRPLIVELRAARDDLKTAVSKFDVTASVLQREVARAQHVADKVLEIGLKKNQS